MLVLLGQFWGWCYPNSWNLLIPEMDREVASPAHPTAILVSGLQLMDFPRVPEGNMTATIDWPGHES